MGFGVPWVATVYAYSRIFLFVREKRQALQAHSDAGKSGQNNRGISSADASLLRSTFTIFVLFFTMWSPYALLILCDPEHAWPDEVYVVAGFFAHTNSSVNSILYAVTNRNFRDGYLKIIRCRWKTVQVGVEQSNTKSTAISDTVKDAEQGGTSNNKHESCSKSLAS